MEHHNSLENCLDRDLEDNIGSNSNEEIGSPVKKRAKQNNNKNAILQVQAGLLDEVKVIRCVFQNYFIKNDAQDMKVELKDKYAEYYRIND